MKNKLKTLLQWKLTCGSHSGRTRHLVPATFIIRKEENHRNNAARRRCWKETRLLCPQRMGTLRILMCVSKRGRPPGSTRKRNRNDYRRRVKVAAINLHRTNEAETKSYPLPPPPDIRWTRATTCEDIGLLRPSLTRLRCGACDNM